MNILLCIAQVFLALLALAGGGYKLFAYAQFTTTAAAAALPRPAWGAIGAFEMLCGVLLILPMALKFRPVLTPAAATALVVESLVLALLYSRYSLRIETANPMVWVLLMAMLGAFVAYGRFPR
jgi:hypothetical protein